MIKVPFHREIEELFASDKSAVLKLIAGAFVGGFGALGPMLKAPGRGGVELSTSGKATFIGIAAAIGAVVVLLLMLRDVVVSRVQRGHRVNPLLRAYFGQGNGRLMLGLWFVTVIVVTFVVTILAASLGFAY